MSDDYARFCQTLRSTHRYATDSSVRRALMSRVPGLGDLAYHLATATAYQRGWWFALRRQMDDAHYAALSLRLLRLAEAWGGRLEVAGMEHVGGTPGPVVIVSNHMSMLETYLLPALILPFKRMAFVVKRALLTYPFLGQILRQVPSIAVSRSNPRDDLRRVLTEGRQMLQAGISVTVFPQSTRSPYLDVEEMNTLGAKLAGMAGVPMVPLALATDFQGNGRLFKDFGRIDCRRPIRFEFGPPVPVEGHGREAHERVVAFIAERLKAWGVPVRQRST